MFVEVLPHGFDCDFGGLILREHEDTGGYAAEGDTFEVIDGRESEARIVTGSQQFFIFSGQVALHDRPDGVKNELCREVIARRDLGPSGRLGRSLRPHDLVTFFTQFHSGHRIDDVVDAAVERLKAAEHLTVRRIDDGICL